MVISDWSSDVCSSDLTRGNEQQAHEKSDEDAPCDPVVDADENVPVEALLVIDEAISDEETDPRPGGRDYRAVAARQVERALLSAYEQQRQEDRKTDA